MFNPLGDTQHRDQGFTAVTPEQSWFSSTGEQHWFCVCLSSAARWPPSIQTEMLLLEMSLLVPLYWTLFCTAERGAPDFQLRVSVQSGLCVFVTGAGEWIFWLWLGWVISLMTCFEYMCCRVFSLSLSFPEKGATGNEESCQPLLLSLLPWSHISQIPLEVTLG